MTRADLPAFARELGQAAARTPGASKVYPSLGAFLALEAELRRHGAGINRDLHAAFVTAYRAAVGAP